MICRNKNVFMFYFADGRLGVVKRLKSAFKFIGLNHVKEMDEIREWKLMDGSDYSCSF
jgi:hypothetical protein